MSNMIHQWTGQEEVGSHGNVDMDKIAESQLDRN